MAETKIVVGPQPFSVGEEYPWLAERDEDGAVVTFTGKVRNHNLGDSVKALTLEHYPGMTEKALAEIVDEARNRWPLGRVTVIHRIGELWPGDEIVLSVLPVRIAAVRLKPGSLLWIISKPAHRSGSAKPRRKATAGSKLGRAISRRQNAGSLLLAG